MITPRGSLSLMIFKRDVKLCEIITTNATRCVFVCLDWTTSSFVTRTSATTFSAEVEITIICSSVVAIMEFTLRHSITSSPLGQSYHCHHSPSHCHKSHSMCLPPNKHMGYRSNLRTLIHNSHNNTLNHRVRGSSSRNSCILYSHIRA